MPLPPAIIRFFDRYAAYFSTSDSLQIAAMYAFPATFLSATGESVILDRPGFLRNCELVLRGYDELGVRTVDHRLIGDSPINGVVRLVEMEWIFLDATGARLTDFRTRYIVRDYAGHLTILGVVEVNETERLAELRNRNVVS
ncbi:hypothetical protein [Lewinella sp. IMCC34183]|uniref:hypothetical protein n=1 Tax=Lewinella sp. IMCC34183 TaxID=2248762 RepID=UPI000E23E831|nr:hypothetical protein [Lewinella sp. IMCC34183]